MKENWPDKNILQESQIGSKAKKVHQSAGMNRPKTIQRREICVCFLNLFFPHR